MLARGTDARGRLTAEFTGHRSELLQELLEHLRVVQSIHGAGGSEVAHEEERESKTKGANCRRTRLLGVAGPRTAEGLNGLPY